ncbi:MAG: hypothetical protein HY731_14110, partial [Candidatus Tectomicrobia bacterium]|nr:hypothetical protein [Candidatus Tectomicrobia bacterium]
MWKDQKGLTYIEILVAIPITLLFLGIVMNIVIGLYKNWLLQQEVVKLQREVQVGIQEIYKDLAMAGYSIGGGEPITLADRRSVTFQSNRNADNSVEAVTYQRSSEQLPLAQLLRSSRPLADR